MTSNLTVLMVTTYAGGIMAIEGITPEVRNLWDDSWMRPEPDVVVAEIDEPTIAPYALRQQNEIDIARLEVEAAQKPTPESLWS